MTVDNTLAEILLEACTAGDLASMKMLLHRSAYIIKALETEERFDANLDANLPITFRGLSL